MSKDLERRLDRLATELTQGAVAPPPAAARRRGRRHRRRQLALGAVLVVAVAGVWAGPGAGLLDRPGSPSAAPERPPPWPHHRWPSPRWPRASLP
jgi:ferric-dicitrate binding protein FerR (iron transport regulator)